MEPSCDVWLEEELAVSYGKQPSSSIAAVEDTMNLDKLIHENTMIYVWI